MKVACVGGGPAGLYLSILLKRQDPSHDVTVHERDPEGSTYGWGVTYWQGLLDRLRDCDPESASAIEAESVRWNEGVAHVRDLATRQPGDEGHGIGRHKLLEILAARARALGVRLEYESGITAENLPDADLVVAGDGVHSVLRTHHADDFGAELTPGRNSYIWLGTTKVFDSFTFAFVETEHGWIWCYGYPFSSEQSTCVIECAPDTLAGLGLDRASEGDGLARLGKLFAHILDGRPLIGRAAADGSTQWLTFRTLTNRSWYRGNLVLLGDAAHTTHYSIGAGTTLALEDAIALADALRESADLPTALARYEGERKSALLSLQSAARYSAQWYENLTRYIHLPRSRCSPCSASATHPCCPTSRPSCTTGSTGPPGSWGPCAGSSAGWGRSWRAARTPGR